MPGSYCGSRNYNGIFAKAEGDSLVLNQICRTLRLTYRVRSCQSYTWWPSLDLFPQAYFDMSWKSWKFSVH